jgi:hypothetical protein
LLICGRTDQRPHIHNLYIGADALGKMVTDPISDLKIAVEALHNFGRIIFIFGGEDHS